MKILGIVLIAVGLLALIYGGYDYTRKTHDVELGPIGFSVKQKKRLEIPVWAGVGLVVAGAAALASKRR